MPTETLPTRADQVVEEKVGRGFALAIVLHLLVVLGIGGWAYVAHARRAHFGDQQPVAGSIQASVVSALPLPPRKASKDVLASERQSEAPKPPPPQPPAPKAQATPAPPKAQVAPRKDEILIPNKPQPRTIAKEAERPQPTSPRRAAQTPPPTPKATSGETSGLQVPAAMQQMRNGTASITVEERAFGDRYAYYIQQISRKVDQSWSEQQVDQTGAQGKKTTVTFTIDRDGDPIDAHVTTQSGFGQLDQAALRAIQRIDTFGPLPAGNNIVIAFTFDFHTQ